MEDFYGTLKAATDEDKAVLDQARSLSSAEGDKASASQQRSHLGAFLDPIPPGARFTVERVAVALSTICSPCRPQL